MEAAARGDGVDRLGLLASAISRRALRVAPAQPGELAWTDGEVLFLDPDASPRAQLESLAVQAALLAAGSLESGIVRGLTRRPALTRRYLAVEGHRALSSLESLLPPGPASMVPVALPVATDSATESLAAARAPAAVVEAPESFGAIHPRRLLAARRSVIGTQGAALQQPGGPRALRELADDAVTDEAGDDLFASPVGGGGAIGRWLSRLLSAVRQLHGGGSPGADAPSHWTPAGTRGRRQVGVVDAAPAVLGCEPRAAGEGGSRYPEWDAHRNRYRPDWCTVFESEADAGAASAALELPERSRLRRALARLGLGIGPVHRQSQGDDIDLDAAVEARVDLLAGVAPAEDLFVDSVRRRRDLSVLLLLDVSGSAAEPAGEGRTVHDQQCTTAAALALTLHELGDRVGLYAYCSRGRSAVQLTPVKRLNEDLGVLALQRLHALQPGGYSRLGAAIRHGVAVLHADAGTPRRLLVVLSDGLAYDHGYEPVHGAADVSRALEEARQDGVGCLCLSVGASTEAHALRRAFGSSAHAALASPAELSRLVGPLFRAALASADLRRRL